MSSAAATSPFAESAEACRRENNPSASLLALATLTECVDIFEKPGIAGDDDEGVEVILLRTADMCENMDLSALGTEALPLPLFSVSALSCVSNFRLRLWWFA